MLTLIPAPSGAVSLSGGTLSLPQALTVDRGPFGHWCTDAFFQRLGLSSLPGSFLTLRKDPSLPAEGYRLEVRSGGITVTASGEAGVVWALTTVYCLSQTGGIPLGVINDAPKYPHRGISLDCARHFFPALEVKKLIEHLSLSKINVLHWHLADDQAWRIESRRFPRLHEVSGEYYTQAEISEIVEFARLRGVEIVPEIDMPGHTTGILAAYPQYSCREEPVSLATKGGIYPIILCPGKDSTFRFLRELLEELVPLFPGRRFHAGGDEAPKSEWKQCPHCRARMEALGITDFEALQGWFTRQICDILESMGKTVICWNEVLRGDCPDSVQVQYWTMQYESAMEGHVARNGSWIFSEMFDLYLDYPHAMNSLKKAYLVKPWFGKVTQASHGRLLGLEACLWSEHIIECSHLERQIFPRMFALAEAAWTGAGSYREFRGRLRTMLAAPLHAALTVTPETGWDPRGKARQQEALGYMAAMSAGMDTEAAADTMGGEDNKEAMAAFYMGFVTKFFRPWDLPKLLKLMKQ